MKKPMTTLQEQNLRNIESKVLGHR